MQAVDELEHCARVVGEAATTERVQRSSSREDAPPTLLPSKSFGLERPLSDFVLFRDAKYD